MSGVAWPEKRCYSQEVAVRRWPAPRCRTQAQAADKIELDSCVVRGRRSAVQVFDHGKAEAAVSKPKLLQYLGAQCSAPEKSGERDVFNGCSRESKNDVQAVNS